MQARGGEGDDGLREVERVVANLRVLGRVEVGQKVGWSDGRLYVLRPSPLTALRRLLRAESRYTTLQVLETLAESSVQAMARVCSERREDGLEGSGDGPVGARLQRAQLEALVGELASSMRSAIGGLRRVAETYEGDSGVLARLEVMECKLRAVTSLCERGL